MILCLLMRIQNKLLTIHHASIYTAIYTGNKYGDKYKRVDWIEWMGEYIKTQDASGGVLVLAELWESVAELEMAY